MCSYNPAKTVIDRSYVLGIWDLKAGLVLRAQDGFQHHFSRPFPHKGLTLFVTETRNRPLAASLKGAQKGVQLWLHPVGFQNIGRFPTSFF